MELTFTIDTDDLYDRETDFESLLSEELSKTIIQNCKVKFASDKFTEFASLTSDTIIANVKLKMENFLQEEIILTERYGEKTFVGSIEDLIKKRFDDVLLRPVDGSGKTLQGCTTVGKTWIEWRIEQMLKGDMERHIYKAQKDIEQYIESTVKEKIIEIKDTALKQQVDNAFVSILNRTPRAK